MAVAGFATVEDGSPADLLDCPSLGPVGALALEGRQVTVACGSNALRRDLTVSICARGGVPATIVHPAAIVSPSARIRPARWCGVAEQHIVNDTALILEIFSGPAKIDRVPQGNRR